MAGFIAKLSRKLPVFRGKYRLLRYLSATQINTVKDLTVTGRFDIKYLLPNINEVIGFSIYINGIYEPQFIDFIIKQIPANGILIDAGANIGSICIPVSRRRPDITIVAIEASPKVFRYLEHNVKMNKCVNIRLVNKALSDIDGASVEFYSPDELFGKGSMNPVFTKHGELVRTVTVDSLVDECKLPKVDLMKIDVEGHEKKVFEGMYRLFRDKKVDKILFEFVDWAEKLAGFNPGDAQAFLKEKGFQLSLCNGNYSTKLDETVKEGSAMLLAKK